MCRRSGSGRGEADGVATGCLRVIIPNSTSVPKTIPSNDAHTQVRAAQLNNGSVHAGRLMQLHTLRLRVDGAAPLVRRDSHAGDARR